MNLKQIQKIRTGLFTVKHFEIIGDRKILGVLSVRGEYFPFRLEGEQLDFLRKENPDLIHFEVARELMKDAEWICTYSKTLALEMSEKAFKALSYMAKMYHLNERRKYPFNAEYITCLLNEPELKRKYKLLWE